MEERGGARAYRDVHSVREAGAEIPSKKKEEEEEEEKLIYTLNNSHKKINSPYSGIYLFHHSLLSGKGSCFTNG